MLIQMGCVKYGTNTSSQDLRAGLESESIETYNVLLLFCHEVNAEQGGNAGQKGREMGAWVGGWVAEASQRMK